MVATSATNSRDEPTPTPRMRPRERAGAGLRRTDMGNLEARVVGGQLDIGPAGECELQLELDLSASHRRPPPDAVSRPRRWCARMTDARGLPPVRSRGEGMVAPRRLRPVPDVPVPRRKAHPPPDRLAAHAAQRSARGLILIIYLSFFMLRKFKY